MSGSKSEVSPEILASVSTPDLVESRLGTLEFDDGAPSEKTAALLYDHLDFVKLYNPLQPFFDKTWWPSEIEPI